MVVVLEVVAAGGSDGGETVVGQEAAEMAAGGGKGVVELVVRVVHTIYLESGFETTLVETGVVRHERQPLYERLDFLPHTWKHRSILGVIRTQPVDLLAEPLVIFRFRMYQALE